MICKGDKVKLKDGTAVMKVTDKSENYAECEWTNARGHQMKGHFPLILLELALD